MKIKTLSKHIAVTAILFVGTFLLGSPAYALTWAEAQEQIKTLTQRTSFLEERVFELKDNYRILYEGAKNQNDQISDQISFAGYFLGVVSLCFTIVGILLAFYINNRYDKVKEIETTVKKVEESFAGRLKWLYEQIKREDTLGLLRRLEEVPEDIGNLCQLLLARDLQEDDYASVKLSYLKLKNSSAPISRNSNEFVLLLMQHFPYQAIKDVEFRAEIISSIDYLHMQGMFSRDVKCFFDGSLKYLGEVGIESDENKLIIKNLFSSYFFSRFRTDLDIQTHIRAVLIRYQLKTDTIASLVKEAMPTNPNYAPWVDIFFS